MVAKFVADLTREVSQPRLEKYRPAGGSDLAMAVCYLWNMALAEALTPSLAALEIGLRNSVHNAMTTHYGTDMWFDLPPFRINHGLDRERIGAIDRIRSRGGQLTSGRVIAEFHFVYWTILLSRQFHQSLWNPNRAALLRAVFPNLTGQAFRRDRIHARYNTIRLFRNRVFHHEPIIFGFATPNTPALALDVVHASIIESIGWTSPTLQSCLALFDRFPDLWTNGRAKMQTNLIQLLGP